MSHYDTLLSTFEKVEAPEEVKKGVTSPFVIEHEVLHAAALKAAEKCGVNAPPLQLHPLKSGAVPLFHRLLFPWGGLPYPQEHAQLGSYLLDLRDPVLQAVAKGMLSFQQATLDHRGEPLLSLFSQERGVEVEALRKAVHTFLQKGGKAIREEGRFVDEELGMVCQKAGETTALGVASGCKSGLGAFLVGDVGLVNWGPQLSPLGDCKGFGLAGRGKNIVIDTKEGGFSLSFTCRLATPSERAGTLPSLQEGGSGLCRLQAQLTADSTHLEARCQIKEETPGVVWALFGKAEECWVVGSHKLTPGSLDRYQGPSQPFALKSKQGVLFIERVEEMASMEIIPLAGDKSFWGGNFLIAFRPRGPHFQLRARK